MNIIINLQCQRKEVRHIVNYSFTYLPFDIFLNYVWNLFIIWKLFSSLSHLFLSLFHGENIRRFKCSSWFYRYERTWKLITTRINSIFNAKKAYLLLQNHHYFTVFLKARFFLSTLQDTFSLCSNYHLVACVKMHSFFFIFLKILTDNKDK